MKIAVAGTVMRDEIVTARGERRESFGGILYNVLALAVLAGETDSVVPLCAMAPEHIEAIRSQFFAGHPCIDAACIRPNPAGTDENVLRYRTHSDREERMTLRTVPLTPDDLAAVRDADALLVNFINGRELSRETLAAHRRMARSHVHLDIHNLGKRLDPDGRLVRGSLSEWREWLALVDTVQANEWEIDAMLGSKPESEDDFRAAALGLAQVPTVRAVAVTIGGRGCALAYRRAAGGTLEYLRVPAMDFGEVVDTTGCGDCFSSAFVVEMLRSGSAARAAVLATALSGLNTLGAGLQAIRLEEPLESLVARDFPSIWAGVSAA